MQRVRLALSFRPPKSPQETKVLVAGEPPRPSFSMSLLSIPGYADFSGTFRYAMAEQRRGSSPRNITYECPGCENCRRWKCMPNDGFKLAGTVTDTPIPLECSKHKIREIVEKQAFIILARGANEEDVREKERRKLNEKCRMGKRVACEDDEPFYSSGHMEENLGFARTEPQELLISGSCKEAPIVSSAGVQSAAWTFRLPRSRYTRYTDSEIIRDPTDFGEQQEDVELVSNKCVNLAEQISEALRSPISLPEEDPNASLYADDITRFSRGFWHNGNFLAVDEDISFLELPQRAVEKPDFDPQAFDRISTLPTYENKALERDASPPPFYIDHRDRSYSLGSSESGPPLSLLIEVDDHRTPSQSVERPALSSSRCQYFPQQTAGILPSMAEGQLLEPESLSPTFNNPDAAADFSRRASNAHLNINPRRSSSDFYSQLESPSTIPTRDTSTHSSDLELPPQASRLQRWRPHQRSAILTTLLRSESFYQIAEKDTNLSPPTFGFDRLYADDGRESIRSPPPPSDTSLTFTHLPFDYDCMSHPRLSDRRDANVLYHQPYPDLESSASLSEFGFEPTLNLMPNYPSCLPRVSRELEKVELGLLENESERKSKVNKPKFKSVEEPPSERDEKPEEKEVETVEERVPVLLGTFEKVSKECDCVPGENAWCNNSVPIFSEPVKAWVPARKTHMRGGGGERAMSALARQFISPGLGRKMVSSMATVEPFSVWIRKFFKMRKGKGKKL